MNRQQKEQAVVELAQEFHDAEAVYAVDFRGLTVTQLSVLRARLLDSDTQLRVVKNTVTKLAANQADVDSINEHLAGPTALAFVKGDAAGAAKTLQGFIRESEDKLQLKGGLLNGKPLSSDDVVSIAKLPSREVLLQQLVTMIASPISGTARTLNAILAAVPVRLQKIVDEGLIGGNAPAASVAPTEAPAPAAADEPKAESADDAAPEADAAAGDQATDEAPAGDESTETQE